VVLVAVEGVEIPVEVHRKGVDPVLLGTSEGRPILEQDFVDIATIVVHHEDYMDYNHTHVEDLVVVVAVEELLMMLQDLLFVVSLVLAVHLHLLETLLLLVDPVPGPLAVSLKDVAWAYQDSLRHLEMHHLDKH
jgi:hypothetical protein